MLYNVIIMSNTLLSIRTDDKTKKDVTDFADSLGLSVSAFVITVLKQTMKEGQLVLTPDIQPSPYLEKAIKRAEADLKAGLASPPLDREGARKHLTALMNKK